MTVSIGGATIAGGITIGDYIPTVSSGLVLSLDAGNPASYPGTGTTWFDVSGNGRNGTLVNGPTYTSAGASGYFTLNGTNYFNTVTATTLGINLVSTPFTLSIWFRTTASSEYYFFDNYNGVTPDISLRIDGGKLETYLSASSGGAFDAIQFGSGYNNNAWTNFAMVWDGVNTIKAYANGVSLGSATQAGLTGNFESGAAFQIGSRPVSGGGFPGDISVMMVYNTALSLSQVSQNFNALRGRYGV